MNIKQQIEHLYKVILGRSADQDGLNFYLNSKLNLYQIQLALWNSDEFKSKFNNSKSTVDPTPLYNKLPIFIINLDRRPDRKQLIESRLANLGIKNYKVIEAIDGKQLPENMDQIYDRKSSIQLFRDLKPTEIACSLSHVEIAKTIINENLDYAVVLEDDAELTIDFKKFIDDFDIEPNKFDFLFLGWFSSNEFFNTKVKSTVAPYTVVNKNCISYLDNPEFNVGNISIHKAFYPFLYLDFMNGTHAYIMSNAGAKKLFEFNYPVTSMSDHMHNYHVDELNTLFVYPRIVNNQIEDSDIMDERNSTVNQPNLFSDIFKNRINHPDFGT